MTNEQLDELYDEMRNAIFMINEETNLQESIEDISIESLISIVDEKLTEIKRLNFFIEQLKH